MDRVVVISPSDLKEMISSAVREAIAAVSHGFAPSGGQTNKVWLSESEAASILGTTASALRSKRCRGKGPAYCKDGGRVVYDRREIDVYLQSRKVTTHGY